MSTTQEQIERLTALKDGKCEVYLLKADAAALDALLREREERNDEGIAENHAIFTLTGVPRSGFSLQQEIRAQLEESQARVSELEAQLQAEQTESNKWYEAMHGMMVERDKAVNLLGASEEARKRAEEKLARLVADVRRVCEDVAPPDAREDVLPTDMLVPHYKLKRLLLALLAEADQKGEE